MRGCPFAAGILSLRLGSGRLLFSVTRGVSQLTHLLGRSECVLVLWVLGSQVGLEDSRRSLLLLQRLQSSRCSCRGQDPRRRRGVCDRSERRAVSPSLRPNKVRTLLMRGQTIVTRQPRPSGKRCIYRPSYEPFFMQMIQITGKPLRPTPVKIPRKDS